MSSGHLVVSGINSFSFFFLCIVFKAKIESDRLIVSVGKKAPQETGIKVKNHCSSLSLAHRRDFKQLLQGITGEGPLRLGDLSFKEFAGFQIALLNKVVLDWMAHSKKIPLSGMVRG